MNKLNSAQNNVPNREFFIDFLKTLAIIFIIIDNSAICWAEECMLPPYNLKLLYGECFWVGQGVPIFLFISGWLFVKWYRRNNIQHLKQCYFPRTLIAKYLRFCVPILIAICVKVILLGCVNGWNVDVFWNLRIGPGWYYVFIVLQLVIVCPLVFALVQRFEWKALIMTFIFSTAFDLIAWGANWNIDTYKFFIPRFVFMISAGIYIAICVEKKQGYKLYLAIPMFVIGLTMLILTYYFNLPMHVDHRWFQDCTIANLYAIPIISLLVRKFKMKNQKWWSFIGRATFNIFLCQNLLLTFPKQIVVANHFILQLLFNEVIAHACGQVFWYGEHFLTKHLIAKVMNYQPKRKQ